MKNANVGFNNYIPYFMNPHITEQILFNQSQGLSQLLSDPSHNLDYKFLEEYLSYYSFFLRQTDMRCTVQLDLDRAQCLNCRNILIPSNTAKSLIFSCNQHSFCTRDCATNYLQGYTGGNLLFWNRIRCGICNTLITRNFMEGIYGKTEFQQYIAKLEEDNEPQFTCDICAGVYKIRECITLNCNHRFCKNCLKADLEIKIGEARVNEKDLVCPMCPVTIDLNIIQAVVSAESFAKYQKFALEQWVPVVDADEIYFQCHGTDCSFKAILLNNLEEFECPNCKTKTCPKCNDVVHKGCSCQAFRLWKEENAKGDEQFELLLKQSQWVQCPWCKQVVERVSGCQFMTCSSVVCRGQKYFCFQCKRGLNRDHEPHACA